MFAEWTTMTYLEAWKVYIVFRLWLVHFNIHIGSSMGHAIVLNMKILNCVSKIKWSFFVQQTLQLLFRKGHTMLHTLSKVIWLKKLSHGVVLITSPRLLPGNVVEAGWPWRPDHVKLVSLLFWVVLEIKARQAWFQAWLMSNIFTKLLSMY